VPAAGRETAAERKLHRFGVRTVADLREMPDAFFEGKSGPGTRLRDLAFGRDDRAVVPEREAKSIGHEHTFGEDVADLDQLRDELLGQVEHVATRLRRAGRLARTVTVKLRHGGSYSQFVTLTRRSTLTRATDATRDFWQAARDLLDAWAARDARPLRLLGVTLGELCDAASAQPELFGDGERDRRVDAALDAVRQRFGERAVRRGVAKR